MGCDFTKISQDRGYGSFQSTHPSWGATGKWIFGGQGKNISIHAPLVGCDDEIKYVDSSGIISIHAPLVGCDLQGIEFANGQWISIHAPLVGCDSAS